jgi:hypothetical protein
MAFRPRRKSGVALYQSPAQRKDTSKIYLLKSLSGLRRKEKIYALGYNLTTLSAVIPGFNVGALGSIPYFLGEISNNATAIQKALKGDMSALSGRGKFLGSANLLNRTASKMVSAISSPTGIGAVDRAANIYIGQQKAQFLHYTRNMGKKEQLKVFVEAIGNGKAFDKEIQRQAQISMKGNVFSKWKALTYYNAVKSAPDPIKENPYYQARKAKRQKNLKRGNFKKTVGETFTTENTDKHIAQLMAQSDDMIGNMGIIQDAAKVLAIDDILVHSGANFKFSSKVDEIAEQYQRADTKRNKPYVQGKSDKRDNVIYRNADPEIKTVSDIFTAGDRGMSQARLERVADFEFDKVTQQFSTRNTRDHHDAAYIHFLKSNKSFSAVNPVGSRGGGTMESILNAATNMPTTPGIVDAFNTYALEMGRLGMNLNEGAGMGDVTSKIFSILFTGVGTTEGSTSEQLMADFKREFGSLIRLTDAIHKEGYPDIAEDLLKVVDPDKKLVNAVQRNAPQAPIPQGSHYMEARKEILQTKQAYSQDLKYGQVFNESDRALNLRKNKRLKMAEIKLMQLDINTGDLESYDEYLHHLSMHREHARTKPQRKKLYMSGVEGTRKQRLRVAKEVMKADTGSFGLDTVKTVAGRKKDDSIIEEFFDSLIEREDVDKIVNTIKTGNDVKRINDKRAKEIIRYVEDGVPSNQILNFIEKEFEKDFKNIKKNIEKAIPDFSELSFKDFTPDQIETKDGLKVDTRAGQSTHFPGHNNYVPTKLHIIDAIHMHDIELSGQSEDDGSGFLFRESVSFGGRSKKSKSADRIRDAVQLEFGGPATDKRGALTNRGDRMFYLPSFFIGTAASQAAAYLGIFDKGAAFKANVNKAGLQNASFKIADEGVGVLNATRKKFNLKKQKEYEGYRRVKSMFADSRKAINNPNKSNFESVAHGQALRLANQRAMSLFKKGGGFGQVGIDDVTNVVSQADMNRFGFAKGPMGVNAKGNPLEFNVNKLGFHGKQKHRMGMQPFMDANGGGTTTRRTYSDGFGSYKFLTGNFSAGVVSNALRTNRDGRVSFETGYAPLVPMVTEGNTHRLLGGAENIPLKKQVGDAFDPSMITLGRASFKDAKNSDQMAAYVANVLGRPSYKDKTIFNMIKDPYNTMDELFHLGATKNGTSSHWHGDYVKGAQSPNHPHNKFMDMFFESSNKLREEMIRDYVEIAKIEAAPVIQVLVAKGDIATKEAVERALAIKAGSIVQTYMRMTGKALQGIGSQVLNEEQFRNLTMTFALLMEANKDHFRFEIGSILKRHADTLRLDRATVNKLKNKTQDSKPFVQFGAGEFDEIERILGNGIAFTYDEDGTPGFASFNGSTGFLKGFDSDDNIDTLISYMPNYSHGNATGRKVNRIYNVNNREDSLLRALGVNNFDEIRFDKSLRFGQQDLSTVNDNFLRGDLWRTANFLAEETGIPAGQLLSDPSAMVRLIMKNKDIAEAHANQQAMWTAKMANDENFFKGISDELASEIFALDTFMKTRGIGTKNRYSKIKQQFGVIVAESNYTAVDGADLTFQQMRKFTKDKNSLYFKVRTSLNDMKSATFSAKNANATGRKLADDIYDLYFEDGITDLEVGKILVAHTKAAKSATEGGILLKEFAKGLSSRSYDGALSGQPIQQAIINARIEGIFVNILPAAGGQRLLGSNFFNWSDDKWTALAGLIQSTNYPATSIDITFLAPVVNAFKEEQKGNLLGGDAPLKSYTGTGSVFKHKGDYYLKIKDKATGKTYTENIGKKRYDAYLRMREKKNERFDK